MVHEHDRNNSCSLDSTQPRLGKGPTSSPIIYFVNCGEDYIKVAKMHKLFKLKSC
jgi:hypothetical protein